MAYPLRISALLYCGTIGECTQLEHSDFWVKFCSILTNLRLYPGANFIICNNDDLESEGRGNGTQCRVVGIKIKDDAQSHRVKNWDGRKVWTVNAEM